MPCSSLLCQSDLPHQTPLQPPTGPRALALGLLTALWGAEGRQRRREKAETKGDLRCEPAEVYL